MNLVMKLEQNSLKRGIKMNRVEWFSISRGYIAETVDLRSELVSGHYIIWISFGTEVDDLELPWTVKTYAITENHKVIY